MILESLDSINWLAVMTAAGAAFAIGVLWFSPVALGTSWARQVSRYTAISQGEITTAASRPTPLVSWLGMIAVTAVVLAATVEAVGAESAVEGVVLGLFLAVGFGATLASWPPIFARMPWQWWLMNSGAFLLMQIAMGAILGSWQ